MEGFLLTPGYIDLSELLFVTTQDQGPSDPGSISGETEDDGNRRNYHRTLAANNSSSSSGTDYYMDGSALDIAVFHLVSLLFLIGISKSIRAIAVPRNCKKMCVSSSHRMVDSAGI